MFERPPKPDQNPGSYVDLLKRVTQRVGEKKVDEKILEILQQAFDEGYKEENMLLSRPERYILFKQVAKTVLEDIIGKFGGKKMTS